MTLERARLRAIRGAGALLLVVGTLIVGVALQVASTGPAGADQPAPTFTSIDPSTGVTNESGNYLVIDGTNLGGATSVTIGGSDAPIVLDLGVGLIVTKPTGSAGTADVVITTPGGTVDAPGAFNYDETAVQWNEDPNTSCANGDFSAIAPPYTTGATFQMSGGGGGGSAYYDGESPTGGDGGLVSGTISSAGLDRPGWQTFLTAVIGCGGQSASQSTQQESGGQWGGSSGLEQGGGYYTGGGGGGASVLTAQAGVVAVAGGGGGAGGESDCSGSDSGGTGGNAANGGGTGTNDGYAVSSGSGGYTGDDGQGGGGGSVSSGGGGGSGAEGGMGGGSGNDPPPPAAGGDGGSSTVGLGAAGGGGGGGGYSAGGGGGADYCDWGGGGAAAGGGGGGSSAVLSADVSNYSFGTGASGGDSSSSGSAASVTCSEDAGASLQSGCPGYISAYWQVTAPPSVTGIAPDAGAAAGGNTVTVYGEDFTPDAVVDVGSTAAATTYVSPTELTVVMPPGTVHSPDLTVTNAVGTSPTSSADVYTYGQFSSGTAGVIANPSSTSFGHSITYSATVTGNGVVAPTGSVAFQVGGVALCSGSVDTTNGHASCSSTAAAVASSEAVTASYSGDDTYLASSGTGTVSVSPGSQTLEFTSTPPAPGVVGGSYAAAATGGASGNPVVLTVDSSATSTCSISGDVVSFTGLGSCVIDANQAGTGDYSPAPEVQQSIPVYDVVSTLSWAAPSPIVYGQALTARQLDAKASAPGTITYSPPLHTVLGAGPHTLTATFTPRNASADSPASATVTLVVDPATPAISWPAIARLIYGTPLPASDLDATSPVAGTFSYSSSAGTVLPGGSTVITATFTPSDSTDYVSVSFIRTASVAAAATAMSLSVGPATYGAEASDQLSATVTSAGGSPPGTVYFRIGTRLVCSASLAASGAGASAASCSPSNSALRPGRYSVVASLAASRDFVGSTSSPASLVISAAPASRVESRLAALHRSLEWLVDGPRATHVRVAVQVLAAATR